MGVTFTPVKDAFHQLNHNMYNEPTHHYLREVSTDPPDEVTEFLNDMETTTESIAGSSTEEMTVTTETTSTQMENLETVASTMELTTIYTTVEPESSSSESSQTILIVLGLLLAILLIVCCVLACIFARMRRKGFCTVEGKNQATCDDDCQENGVTLQQSPKASMSSGKSENSRSSEKLLTK